MKSAMIAAAMLATSAQAAPDPGALFRSALPAGFAPAVYDAPPVAVPVPALVRAGQAADAQTVALAPLLDRHLSSTDAVFTAAGKTLLAGTLDVNGDGYFAVTPPGRTPHFIKIERNMAGSWSDGVRTYRASLSVSIFRPRLDNYIQIHDAATGQLVWEKRISELFRLTYAAGEPVNLAGRAYRLFYSAKPNLGLCFIYDEVKGGKHDYKFYMVPMVQIMGSTPTSYKMYGGDVVKLRASADLATLFISR